MPNKEKLLKYTTNTSTFPELLLEIAQIIEAKNNWKDDLWFLEFAPNILTSGEINKIGKISEWRATISKGYDLDNIYVTHNFFGKTPKEAIMKLRSEISTIIQ